MLIEMAELIVEHEWKSRNAESVMKVVGDIIGMQKGGSLPKGFNLKSVVVLNGENRAICNWDAPDANSLKELIGKVNPPTKHRVFEASRAL